MAAGKRFSFTTVEDGKKGVVHIILDNDVPIGIAFNTARAHMIIEALNRFSSHAASRGW